MHNAAFAALGLDWAYVPMPVPPDRVGEAVRGLTALGFAGANVTVPHKQAVMPFLDEVTPIARALGAVNTIVVRPDGSLLGDNTDGAGLMAALRAHGVSAGRVLVLGAGGAARAVVYALAEAGATVAVANRTPDRAWALCRTIGAALEAAAETQSAPKNLRDLCVSVVQPSGRLTAHPFPDALPALAAEADLIVNTTSLGLHEGDPLPWDPSVAFRPGQVVYDLVFNRPTELLALARSQGATAMDGLGMLVHQGALAFEMWTGQEAPVGVMAEAIREA